MPHNQPATGLPRPNDNPITENATPTTFSDMPNCVSLYEIVGSTYKRQIIAIKLAKLANTAPLTYKI